MRETSEDNLRARVVEPLHHRPGPAFSSFSAFATATATSPPQVAQVPPTSPLVRIESHSDEDLAGLRRWHDGESESLQGVGPATANVAHAPAPRSPQPLAAPESLFGGDDLEDYEDEPTVRAVEPAPQPPATLESLFDGDNLEDYEDEPAIPVTEPAPQPPAAPESPLFGGDDSDDDDDDEPTIIGVKPAPEPQSKKAREAAAQVQQVKREPTEADIDALLDEIFQENRAVHGSPPAELFGPRPPVVVVAPQVPAPPPVVRLPTASGPVPSPSPSPPIRDVEMDVEQVRRPHMGMPHVSPVSQPFHVHVHDRTMARPQAREVRSLGIVDIEMEVVQMVQAVQVSQPLRSAKGAGITPVKAEPMETETSLVFDDSSEEEELWRELYAMQRDLDEWFRGPLPPAPTLATAASVSGELFCAHHTSRSLMRFFCRYSRDCPGGERTARQPVRLSVGARYRWPSCQDGVG